MLERIVLIVVRITTWLVLPTLLVVTLLSR